jgi:hypothetical protein
MDKNKKLVSMFNKLLKDYRQSQRTVICEFSGNMDRDFALLEDDVKKRKNSFKKLIEERRIP